jgi:branched-chain amino acid transport system substrate-binding protein
MLARNVGFRWLVAALVASLLPLVGVGAEETVRVGVLGQRVGSNPTLGRAYEEAIALALQTINEDQGGVLGKRMEVVFEDSGASPERARSALQKLIAVEGVVLSVGETQSQGALAEIEIAEQYRHPLIVAEALADDVTAKNSRYVFRAGPSNSGVIQETLMGFILENGFQRIAMIVEDTNFGQNAAALIQAELKSRGLPALGVPASPGTLDLAWIMGTIKEYLPDLIVVLHHGLSMEAVVEQMPPAGFPNPLPFCVSGPSLAGRWGQDGENRKDNSHLILRAERIHSEVDETVESHKLRRIYRDKFGKELADYRVRSIYDVLLIAADSLRRAGSGDCEQLVAALEQTHLSVASGVVRFGTEPGSYRYHHWQSPLLMVQWQAQRSTAVYPRSVATGVLQR